MLGPVVLMLANWFLGAKGESIRAFADRFRHLPLT
jgi:hypothetical protein